MNNLANFVQMILGNSQFMQNPMMKNAMELYKKGDVNGLEQLTKNIASQKGINIEDVRKNIGI